LRTAFRTSFLRDLKRIRDEGLKQRVARLIEQVEQAENLHVLDNVRKLAGHGGYYRVRLGDYRVGLAVEGDTATFVRCLHRRDIYRHFP